MKIDINASEEIKAAVIQAGLTLIVGMITATAVIWQIKANRDLEYNKSKKEAYEAAFKVINYSLASVTIANNLVVCKPNAEKWPAMSAREAVDKLTLYSGKPAEAIALFQDAIGVKRKASLNRIDALRELRYLALQDIGTTKNRQEIDVFKDAAWLASIPGSDSANTCEAVE